MKAGEESKNKLMKLKRYLSEITEPRRVSGNFRHRIEDILIIGLCTLICGGEDFVNMEQFGEERKEWLEDFLELPNGIPDSDTFRRVFERVNPKELAEALNHWLETETRNGGRSINIDGKTIRGSSNEEHKAYHVVSAWVGENSITLGELVTEEKSNEITAIPELLDLLEIEGDIVTIDAMGCQKNIALKIREKGADYVLAVKDNHPTLQQNIKDYFDWMEKERPYGERYDRWMSGAEKCHGRIEKREIVVCSAEWMLEKAEWEDMSTIICYRCTRIVGEVETRSERYYISSFDTSAEGFEELLRGHWSIENQLHWVLDVIFGEDACKARKDNSPLNLNVLRKIALARLKTTSTVKKMSLNKKRFSAALNCDFLTSVIFQK